jgi:hypothetical protein
MLGWMIVFALLAVFGVGINVISAGELAPLSLKLTSLLFAVLFFITIAVRFVRGRA